MTWVFVLIAFTTSGATVERVLLDNPAQCVAYGQGYLSHPEMHAAQVQVAQCVGLRSGEVMHLRNPATKKGPP